ncbi:putative ribosomal-protein-alanine acetyltransferase [Rhizocola hellebori]|uniref:Putative ribosomal-protein-alanine acetyltransferase n=1 Tax=Rhizocola hellebori TaxID=1392758 RepID=A0A8J3VGY2_9ACTN|nr:GNAT family protein [Rhizocola hellebori]GIH05667.1 putative ribosomal-protein-alanine acetyltransferase [Rhizocola hellebori]
MTITRLLSLDDADALTELIRENREFLAPWEPARAEEYFTVEGQRTLLQTVLEQHGRGQTLPHVILDSGRVVGRITLNEIVRGPLQSSSVGYWVEPAVNGRGIASAALAEIIQVAFTELGLHRLQAGTLLHNKASQRVLERNGFVRYGLAPRYLNIAGKWQDHLLFQLLNE